MMLNLSSDHYNTIISYLTYDDAKNLSQCSKMCNKQIKDYKKKIYRNIASLYDIDEIFLEDIVLKIDQSYDIFNLIISNLPQKYIIHNLSTTVDTMISPILKHQYDEQNNDNDIELLLTNTGKIFEILKMIKIYYRCNDISINYINEIVVQYFSKIFIIENTIVTFCCPLHKNQNLQWSNSDLRYICNLHPFDWIHLELKKYVNASFCFTTISKLDWEYSNIDLYNFLKSLWQVSFDQIEDFVLLHPEINDNIINKWFSNACLENHDSTYQNIISLLDHYSKNHYKVLYILIICLKYHIYIFQTESFEFTLNDISHQKILSIVKNILDNVELPEQFSLWVTNTIKTFNELISQHNQN